MKIIAYDLGTGGVKASLYDGSLQTIAKTFVEYPTFYPKSNYHEQRPLDWWQGVIDSTKMLLEKVGAAGNEVACVSLSGHSLVALPVDGRGNLLMDRIPIWSDTRAQREADEFFSRIPEKDWYMTTGNGFPAACYSLFKLMWLKKNEPGIFEKAYKILGSKDFINYMLTGEMCTDHSYASGMGCYDLLGKKMKAEYLDAAGLSPNLFPPVAPSHQMIGKLTAEAAQATGLSTDTSAVCGGVDNACMALGAVGPTPGRVYTSLGSSSWIPANCTQPILDYEKKPYTFAHIQEDLYTSAFSIFSGGSSFRWVREELCRDIKEGDTYTKMTQMAEGVPIGSNGIFFNPSLAGGSSQDKSIHIRGAYVGLHLGTTREDMVRAAMEGIALNLKMSLNYLVEHAQVENQILFSGGGSKSKYWMQMFADIFDKEIVKTNIDQDTASIGAAAIAARSLGLWKDYTPIYALHRVENRSIPDPQNAREYAALFQTFAHVNEVMAELGDYMHAAGEAGAKE